MSASTRTSGQSHLCRTQPTLCRKTVNHRTSDTQVLILPAFARIQTSKRDPLLDWHTRCIPLVAHLRKERPMRSFNDPWTCPRLTKHATERLPTRCIRGADVARTLEHGRSVHVRGAEIYVVGRREIKSVAEQGLDISDLHGLHVVCASDTGVVITAYRNRNLRGLRPRRRGRQWKPSFN